MSFSSVAPASLRGLGCSLPHGLVDGTIDVQAIRWLAPLRHVDALIALRCRLARKGIIELATPKVENPESTRILV